MQKNGHPEYLGSDQGQQIEYGKFKTRRDELIIGSQAGDAPLTLLCDQVLISGQSIFQSIANTAKPESGQKAYGKKNAAIYDRARKYLLEGATKHRGDLLDCLGAFINQYAISLQEKGWGDDSVNSITDSTLRHLVWQLDQEIAARAQ